MLGYSIEFELNLSNFSSYFVISGVLDNFQALGTSLVRNQGKTQTLDFVKVL